ncbi:MAG: peroxidase, partial [Candidatus Acidiferrales bacterium]
ARHLGVDVLTAEQVGIASTGWHGETPLWYYILREAYALAGGHRLGPVGGEIVAEVFVGLMDADPMSYRHAATEWRPRKTLAQLLTSKPRA